MMKISKLFFTFFCVCIAFLMATQAPARPIKKAVLQHLQRGFSSNKKAGVNRSIRSVPKSKTIIINQEKASEKVRVKK